MIVRDFIDADLDAVLAMAAAFCAAAGEDFERDHALTNLAGIRHAGFLLVAEDAGQLIGMVAAVAGPGLCTAKLRMHEVCLWVEPGARRGAALMRLIRAFDRRAEQAGVSGAQLSLLPSSPEGLAAVYRRMGYGPGDSSFIKRYGSS